MWLPATSTAPSGGTCSRPSNLQLNHSATGGRTRSSANRNHGSGLRTRAPGHGGRGYSRSGVQVIAVPVKSLDIAKRRLAGALSPPERAVLTLAMLEDVLDACLAQRGWDVWVISRSEAVLEVAARRRARPVGERAGGLRRASVQGEPTS